MNTNHTDTNQMQEQEIDLIEPVSYTHLTLPTNSRV